MVAYVIAGMALGSIYAIASAGLVVTYVSAGILNFAFGSMAFFIARCYYWLHSEHGWSIIPAAVMSLLVIAPLLGAALYQALFRHLRRRSPLIKIVSTVGLSVALPPLATLLFGDLVIPQAPGLAPLPLKVFHVFGAAVNLDQVIIYCFLAGIVVVGSVVLRFTDVGLKIRAMVDSEALTELSGTSAARVALGVWTVSSMLAGLAGILIAPTSGLTVGGMTTLMATAFAAVVAARLRNLATAVAISLAMGVITDVVQKYLPSDSTFTAAVIPSIPFAFILLFLLYYLVRGGAVGQETVAGGTLDAAIRTRSDEASAPVTTRSTRSTRRAIAAGTTLGTAAARAGTAGATATAGDAATGDAATGGATTSGVTTSGVTTSGASGREVGLLLRSLPPVPLLFLAAVALLPALTSGYWLGLVASGLTLAVVLLSFSLVTGDGGMLWLCQITFAGGGAITAAQLATHAGIPSLAAAVAAGVVMAPIGVLLGALTIRLGDLYVALVTLSFGLLAQTLIFTRPRFYQFGAGVEVDRPGFAENDRAFAYVTLGIFLLLGLVITNVRRSTTGLGVSAVRWSEPAARTLGLSVTGLKVLLSGFAAFVAGLGGALMALFARVAVPDSYMVFGGLVWIAVLVTIGSRSVVAAAVAGLSFTVLPGVIATYLPTAWGNAPGVLFGLGALGVALHPEGVIAATAVQLRALIPRPPRPTSAGAGIGLRRAGVGVEAGAGVEARAGAGRGGSQR